MSNDNSSRPVLETGRNCWRRTKAGRIAFLVDGADYFRAVREAAVRARRSIIVLAWDIDSRMQLVPDGAQDGFPPALGDFFNALVKKNRDLQVHLLDWDFAMLYASDRELLPRYKLGWRTRRRVHFELDGAHPVGSSHHQKIVVVDDALAFVGGLDMTHCRWDTSEHRADEPHRRHPSGDPCPAFHDVQMAVDGAAAAALGELARERWHRATGKSISPAAEADSDPWPASLQVDLRDAEVGIARTEPAYEGRPGVQEIKRLHMDAIAAAQHSLYLENQYFSASTIAEALGERLAEPEGPEVMLVSRLNDSGWLEESTMGVLRARLHKRLRETASSDRYGSFYPRLAGPEDHWLNVHSKVLVMDDELLTIGSANLNNRSMGFDTECNLVLEACGDQRIRDAISAFRRRLLAEHLGVAEETVAGQERDTPSLLETVEAVRGGERTLELLEPELPPGLDQWLPGDQLIDPEKPVEPTRLIARLMPGEQRASGLGRGLAIGGLLLFFLALAATWRWTELGDMLTPDRLGALVESLKKMPASPLLVLGAFVLGTVLVVPVTLMIVAVVLVFGPWLGMFYAFAGSLLGAAVTFGIGQLAGRRWVRRLAGSRLERLSRQLGRRGLLSIVAVRNIPVAPFTIVNLVAGATHIRLRDFLLGTLLGLAPGIIGISLFIDRAIAAIRDPGLGSFAILLVVLVVVVAGITLFRRRLRERRALD